MYGVIGNAETWNILGTLLIRKFSISPYAIKTVSCGSKGTTIDMSSWRQLGVEFNG
jgi:hypothetical protein